MAVAKDSDQLDEMRKRRRRAVQCASTLYDKAKDDIEFVTIPGAQWDSALKARRGDRPCYEFPKLQGHTRQVINEMRQTRPQGKVRGTEESDRGLAELMQGICRNIESVSNAERAYDIAFETAVQGGLGIWRICTDYLNDDDFEQDIRIKPVRNFAAVKFDPAAIEIDRRDGNFLFYEDSIPRDDYERQFPDASLTDFDADEQCRDWEESGKICVAEYWYKKPIKRELLALSDGRVVFADDIAKQAGLTEGEAKEFLAAAGVQVVRTREVDSHKVYMRLTNGHEFLTEPYEFPSKYIPFVPVWGNIQNINGEDYWQGMVRPSKDSQRLHNVHRTAAIEAVAKAPKAPFILKMKWIKGLEHFWKKANAEDYPYLPIRDDADGVPERARQAELPAALLQLGAMDNDDIKSATGQHDPSLGRQSSANSGVAQRELKQSGAVATFNYIDNLTYAVRFTYEILVDMIPKVLDTPRVVRTLGADGGEKWKQLYQEVVDPVTGQKVVLNDIRKGKYDVLVTVGPSYASQRMEAVDAFTNMLGQMGNSLPPPIAALMAYTVVKNQDLPGGEDVDAAFRKILVSQGMLEPKDGEQPAQQQPPDPRMEAQVKKMLADAEKSAASAAKTQAEAQAVLPQAQADIQKTIAEAVAQQLQNMMQSGQMALLAQQAMPPPPRPIPAFIEQQPAQAGFFMPGDPGAPQAPQFTG